MSLRLLAESSSLAVQGHRIRAHLAGHLDPDRQSVYVRSLGAPLWKNLDQGAKMESVESEQVLSKAATFVHLLSNLRLYL